MTTSAPPDTSPQRHVVTLLFADLSRSTELAGAMEAEDYAALLGELRRAYNEEIERHGGLVVRVQGDGLLAMFGHPDTREDDARRATLAALALHARVRGLRMRLPAGFALTLHSGIHGGLALVGEGDIERGRFELMGSVPNIAARLADAARADEVLISSATLGRWARHFSCGDEREQTVRGHDEPVRVRQVLAVRNPERAGEPPTGRAGSAASADAGLVGRVDELARLQQDVQLVAAGQARVLALAGPPGMGKTTLAQALMQPLAAAGWRVLQAYCDDHLSAEPMQPFAQVLRELGQGVPDKAAAVLAALRTTLTPVLAQSPVLLFIDDWQWADDASHQLLQALRQDTAQPLLVLLTTRVVEQPQGLEQADTLLVLAPLAEADALRLAQARLPTVDPFVLGEVCRHAGGNPLFLDELCHSVGRANRRDLLFSQPSEQTGLPGVNRLPGSAGWLAHLVESRLRSLPSAQAELVRLAAVIGNVVPAWLLHGLSGRSADDPELRALAEQDFLYPAEHGGAFRFKHGLTRDVVYQHIGLHPRQWLHLRVAAALLQRCADQPETDAVEALAYHFDAGGEPALAARYAERAGDRALAASALDRARAHYRAALAALDRLGLDGERALRWIAIVQRLGLVSLYDPTRADLALVQRAQLLAERQPDLAVRARARYWLGYIHYGLGDAREAVRHGEQALRLAREAGDDPLAVQVVATLGEAHTAAGQYAQALALLDDAIAVKRRHRSGRRTNVGLAFSLVCRACVLGDRGEFVRAEESFAEALGCVVGEEHEIGATIHGWRAAVLLWQGAWALAVPAAVESGRIARATRSLAQYSIACAIEHYAHWMLSGQAESIHAIQEATAWLAPRETGIFRSLNHGWLTEGLLALGQREPARHHAALALKRARHSDRLGLAMSQRALALDAAATGRPDRAARHLARAYETDRARESAHERAATQCCEARIAAAQGQAAQAMALADQAGDAFERMGMHWHLQQARVLADGAGDLPPALLLCTRPLPVTAAVTLPAGLAGSAGA